MDRKTKVAVLTAMQKAIKAELDRERPLLDADMAAMLEQHGTEKVAVLMGGEKVGEVGWSFTKPCPVYTDTEAATDYLRKNGLLCRSVRLLCRPTDAEVDVLCEDYPHLFEPSIDDPEGDGMYIERQGTTYCKATGEAVGFVAWLGRQPKCVSVRIPDPKAVLSRVQPGDMELLVQPHRLIGA